MLKQLLTFLLVLMGASAMAQTVIPMYGDQFIFKSRSGKTSVTFSLPTDNVKGFLYNIGSGAVEFRPALIKLTDTTYLIGPDTLKIPRQSSANAAGTAGGDLYGTYPNPSVDWSHAFASFDQYYLKLSDAASLYASKTSLGSYLLSTDAASTYATQASLNIYLPISSAVSTYATKTSMGSYLLSTDAASLYATKTSLGSYLLSSTAAGTYATLAAVATNTQNIATNTTNIASNTASLTNKADKTGSADIEITDATKGIILKTADGTRARITLIKYNGVLTLQVSDPL